MVRWFHPRGYRSLRVSVVVALSTTTTGHGAPVQNSETNKKIQRGFRGDLEEEERRRRKETRGGEARVRRRDPRWICRGGKEGAGEGGGCGVLPFGEEGKSDRELTPFACSRTEVEGKEVGWGGCVGKGL